MTVVGWVVELAVAVLETLVVELLDRLVVELLETLVVELLEPSLVPHAHSASTVITTAEYDAAAPRIGIDFRQYSGRAAPHRRYRDGFSPRSLRLRQ
ncbi:MAG: hypothetical protein ACLP8S_27805 [Solirubrobacteraceae bacterium]